MYCTNCGMKFNGKFCPVCGKAAYEIDDDYISAQKRVNKGSSIDIPPMNARDIRHDPIPSGANIITHENQKYQSGSRYVSDEKYSSCIRDIPTISTPKPNPQPKSSSKSSIIFGGFAAVAFFCVFILPLFTNSQPNINNNAYTESSVETVVPDYDVIPFPSSGHSVVHNNKTRIAPFILNLPDDGDYYYVVLADYTSDTKVVSIYGHSGDTIEIDVPLGNYSLYYTSGTTWYGSRHKFGDETPCYKADAMLQFYETSDSIYYEEITLYPVLYGNMDSERISENEFPV